MTSSPDLAVRPLSDALQGYSLDLVVSGSIGAVESVRLIRGLRRLGADIYPWLTRGGAQFATETALSWAAARPTIERFEGSASHIALRDACIIAPASASMIGKIAQGITDSPASALVASYLGQKKPVILVANMHDSLLDSPFVAQNLHTLATYCTILDSRQEEGKQKFPEPSVLADEISHLLRKRRWEKNGTEKAPKILLTMGTTRGYIDSIRYISNYSSGALGTEITHEFYRQGFRVHTVSGPSTVSPRSYSHLNRVETNTEMSAAVDAETSPDLSAAIFAASVLDFVPETKNPGKIRSDDELKVNFIKAPKIIAQLTQNIPMKVAFKLETEWNDKSVDLAAAYIERYRLSHLFMNIKGDVDDKRHRARIYKSSYEAPLVLESKEAIASYLAQEAHRLFIGAG